MTSYKSFIPLISAISKERRRTASPSSSSPSRGLPSFRFSAADEELTEILDELADGETEIENNLRIELKGIFRLAPISPAIDVTIDLLFLETETKKNLKLKVHCYGSFLHTKIVSALRRD